MTIKFSRLSAGNTNLTIADGPNLTIADGADFAIGLVVVFNGATTQVEGSGQYQTLFRTGDFSTAGSIVAMWQVSDLAGGTNNGKFYFNMLASSATRCASIPIEDEKAYVLVLQRQSGNITSKLCQVLTVAPTDGTAVTTSLPYAYSGAFDGPGGLIFGNHSVASRRLDQSLCRFFRVDRALTDHEIAQLAYGKEITAFAAPSIYIRANDQTDIIDSGSQANALTVGTFTAGAAPGFGFDSTPTAPTFESTPIISGAAVVGQVVGYTAGVALGNPAPTVTPQWTSSTPVGGAQTDIAGATGATYSIAADDAGKFLRLRLGAANGVSPNATITSDPVAVSSTAVDLTLTSIPAERIFQRIGAAANVPLSGSYVGAAPAKIEAQLYSVDGVSILRPWFDVSATIGSGTWSASPSIDAPTNSRKYRIAVRSKNVGGSTIVTAPVSGRFGVGDIIAVIGSSSPSTWFNAGSGSGKTPNHEMISTIYEGTSTWSVFDTYGQASGMAEHFALHTGVPTAMVCVALGGSNLAQWADAGSTMWARLTGVMTLTGNKLAGLFGSAGSNDIISSSSALTVAAHLEKLRAVATNIRAATGQASLPILWSGINRRYDALEMQANNARAAEREFGEDANVSYVQTLDIEVEDPATGGGGVHPTGAGYATCCNRIKYVWVKALDGIAVRGPRVTGIAYNGAKATITIEHRNGGNDITPSIGATGFVVTDDNGEAAILSVERGDGTRITLTCDRTLVNPKITYLAGAWVNNANPVFDNASTPLPMMAEPFAVAGAGAVFSPISRSFTLTFDVAGAGGGIPPDTTAPVLSGVITPSAVTTSEFTFSWPAATGDVAGYETSIDGGTTYTSAGMDLSRTVSGRTAGTPHAVRVRAHDSASNYSEVLSLTITTSTPADVTGPTFVGTLSVSAQTPGGFTLSWPAATDPSGIAGYEISTNGGSTYVSVGNVLSKAVSGLLTGGVYQVSVRAIDTNGNPSTALTGSATAGTVEQSNGFIPSSARTVTVQPGAAAFSAGPFWTMTDPKKPRAIKDPDSKIDIPFDWGPWLADINDSILSVEFLVDGGLIKGEQGIVGNVAAVFVSAGTSSQQTRASITCRITTASNPSRIEDRTVYLDIEAR